MGILMYELLIGRAPFTPPKNVKNQKLANRMLEKNIMTTKPQYPGFVSREAVDLISACLDKNPKNRPSCREALLHDFFKMNGLKFTTPLPAHSNISTLHFLTKFLVIDKKSSKKNTPIKNKLEMQ